LNGTVEIRDQEGTAFLCHPDQGTNPPIRATQPVKGFAVLKRRWVVERTFGWLRRCRRLAKDFEASIESAVAWVFIAHIRMLTRRLARC
jgi:transposase